MKKKKWQHEETGIIIECSEQPTPRFHELPKCEHGVYGCLMPGFHLPEECHTVEMMESQEAEILEFPGITTQDIDCSKVIEGLQKIEFEKLLAIGIDKDGNLYCASHTSDIGELLLLMERAKHHLLYEVAAE